MKERDSVIEVKGQIVKVMSGSMYKVKMENDLEILGHLSGKMRKFGIKITLGDMVQVELSPYDLTKGRITYRLKG
ncbi:MAG: translation initiation factor IF-1 [Prevotella sp.]|nr:translation initiation factor IF-1 [Prevotella sp.]